MSITMASLVNSPDTLTSIESNSTTFVCPVVGTFDVSGSASIITLDQLKVTMGYQDKYEITLGDVSSNALIHSFVLDGSGSTFAVNKAAGSTDQLASVLKFVIDNAKYRPDVTTAGASDNTNDWDNSGNTLSQVLGQDMFNTFKREILDSLPNILQSADNFSHTVYSQEGADDMDGKLTGAGDAAAAREIIAQQIPQSNYVAWADLSENAVGTRPLPLLNDNELVFIFDVKGTLITRVETKEDGANADAALSGVAGDSISTLPVAAGRDSRPYTSTGGVPGGASYTYSNRRVAFFVKVSGINPPSPAVGHY